MGLRCANEILKDVELSEIKEDLEELRETLEQTGPGAHRAAFPIPGAN
ncbi:hypothetical protein [Methanosarcina sp. MTP4]|nr:hypothetical protein [Methanosarcina sp. MTP4]